MLSPVMPTNEARQFRTLYRLSLARLVDLEIISSRGDLNGLFARVGGILLGLSLTMVLLVVAPFWQTTLAFSELTPQLRNDEEFLISITLAVTGLFSVLAWNSVLPDHQDCLVLGTLPLRIRTIALARLAAILTCIAVIVGAINAFIGFTFPYVMATGLWESLRSIAAWWITVLAAGVFVFSATLAVQGAAAQIFRWNTFLRISGILQLTGLFTVSALFFLAPPFALTMAGNPKLAALLPSFWFTGLLHVLKGEHDPFLMILAGTAIRDLAVVVAFAGCVFALSWIRNVRRIVESPDVASRSGRPIAARFGNLVVTGLFRRPLDRAIVLFTARTAARSKQHRLLLATYGGIGCALALAFGRSLLDPNPSAGWNRPNAPLLVVGMLLMVCAVTATRSVFALPHSLPANWIFRITAVQSPASYFEAVRKSLTVLAATPPVMVCTAAWLAIWPGRFSVEASVVLLLVALILVDCRLYQFRKIPFACSWLPASGQSVNTVRKIAYGVLFLAMAFTMAGIELWALRSIARFVVISACLTFWLAWLRRRGHEFAASPAGGLQFDEIPDQEIFALDLHADSAGAGSCNAEQGWVEAAGSRSARSRGARLRTAGLALLTVLTAGYVYERVGEWRDHRSFPRIGQAIDIGGRSLNLYCAGQGAPTVVMESGADLPGYSWKAVEQGLSTFTRACWYDRAGYGWSDPAPPPRRSADIAVDLHTLLHAAGIAPPYVLVGHSFGGFTIRVFASRYRKETAGLVLVDSASEHENDGEIEIPRTLQAPIHVPEILRPLWWMAVRFFVREGGVRLLGDGPGTPPTPDGPLSERDVAIVHALQLQPKTFDALFQEIKSLPDSIHQVLAVRDLGNMPLIILTAGKRFPTPQDPEETRLLDAYFQYHVYKDQPRMLNLSTRSRQIVLQAGHGIPYEAPGAVINAVQEVLAAIQ
jgi:pimeloyl-ACP methyl ester carboxylesterase